MVAVLQSLLADSQQGNKNLSPTIAMSRHLSKICVSLEADFFSPEPPGYEPSPAHTVILAL